jgi:hypothetical protein
MILLIFFELVELVVLMELEESIGGFFTGEVAIGLAESIWAWRATGAHRAIPATSTADLRREVFIGRI